MPHYTVDVTLTRYVRAGDEHDARVRARCEVTTCVGSAVGIRSTRHRRTTAEPYRHRGAGPDLWRVELWFRMAIASPDSDTAREIAYRAVRLEPVRDCDIFEPELTVGEPEAVQLLRAV